MYIYPVGPIYVLVLEDDLYDILDLMSHDTKIVEAS